MEFIYNSANKKCLPVFVCVLRPGYHGNADAQPLSSRRHVWEVSKNELKNSFIVFFLSFFLFFMFFPQDLHFYLVAPDLFRCRRVCMQYDRRNQSRSLLLLLWECYLFVLFLLNWPRNVPDIYTDDVISQKTEVCSFLSPKQRGHFANEVERSAALQ